MKNESAISRIISAIFGDRIAVRENMGYDTVKGVGDLEPDDFITLRIAESLVAVTPSFVDIPSGTALTSGYVQITYAPYIAFGNNPDKSVELIIDANTTDPQPNIIPRSIFVADVLTYIRVFAADDGTGHTADHLQLVLKQ